MTQSNRVAAPVSSLRLYLSRQRSLLDLITSMGGLIMLWWFATRGPDSVLLPSPGEVYTAAGGLIEAGTLWDDSVVTLTRVLVGYVFGVVGGIVFGVAIGRIELVARYLEPIVGFIRTIPPVAIIPLSIIWFGIGETSKYFVVFFGTIFVVIFNAIDAARNVPRTRLLAAASLGASRRQQFVDVVIPSVIPGIWTGMKTAVGFSFMAVVAAELIAASSGIGNLIMRSRTLLETDKMFVGLAVLALLGGATDWIYSRIGRKMLGRYLDYLNQ